jgi:16S rRNA (guanine527-N7)-methyltransferase
MFHVKHEAWARQAEQMGILLSALQLDQLERYEALLRRIALPRGMIAASDTGRLWERHIWDGLRGVPETPAGSFVADIGSGAGIPGIPLSVAVPSTRFVLIEPRKARAALLEAAVEDLGLSNVEVLPRPVEAATSSFAACVARAFASPLETWERAKRVLAPGGILIYWGGASLDLAVLHEAGVRSRLSARSDLARTGPLVIMGP